MFRRTFRIGYFDVTSRPYLLFMTADTIAPGTIARDTIARDRIPPVGYLPAFDGIVNFRDVGGHGTLDGRTVRTGALYRSAALHFASIDDEARLEALGVRTVIDLRTAGESTDRTLRVRGGWVRHHLPVLKELWPPSERSEEGEPAAYLAERYREMLEVGGGAIAAAIRLIANPANHPVVFHCSAGKDRTGLLAALVQAAVGVPDAIIASSIIRDARGSPRGHHHDPRRFATPPWECRVLPHSKRRARCRTRRIAIGAAVVTAGPDPWSRYQVFT